MQPAIHIKKTIDFNKGFKSLLEVLKLVAVSEYHILERQLKSFERLQNILAEFFSIINVSQSKSSFINPGSQPTGVVAVTSDAGLLGGINMQVVSAAVDLVREHNGKLIVVGERGQLYANGAGLPFVSFPGIVDSQRFSQACQLRDYLIECVGKGEIGSIKVVFPHALSFVVHRVEVATLIPFTLSPAPLSKPEAPDARLAAEQLILESDPEEVAEYLVYLVMGQRLFEIFGMSRVCEQAARFVHLEESCQKIQEMNQKLLLQYFRRRHEIIDANMRELFSARSIYAK